MDTASIPRLKTLYAHTLRPGSHSAESTCGQSILAYLYIPTPSNAPRPYLPTLPIFVGVSRKSARERDGAYANLMLIWAFPDILGAFLGVTGAFLGAGLKNLPDFGGKR